MKFIILVGIAIVFLLFFIAYKHSKRLPCIDRIPLKTKKTTGLVAWENKLAILDKDTLLLLKDPFSKKTQTKKKYLGVNMKSGNFADQKLLIVTDTSLMWIDPDTLELLRVIKLPIGKHTIRWADYFMGKLWVGISNKIFVIGESQVEGDWTLREETLSGGWYFSELFVSDSGGNILRIGLPPRSINATILEVVPVTFTGPFSIDESSNKIWGFSGEDIVSCKLLID